MKLPLHISREASIWCLAYGEFGDQEAYQEGEEESKCRAGAMDPVYISPFVVECASTFGGDPNMLRRSDCISII